MTGKCLPGGRGLAALTICLAAAACGTPRAPVSPRTAPTATPKATPAATASVRPAATHAATAVPPRQRAVEDAKAILAAFVPPPGAVRLAKVPAAASLLRLPPESPAVTNLIDDASLWRAPMAPGAVLDWERAHLPRRFDSAAGIGSGGDIRGQRFYDSSWSLAPLYGVLAYRTMVVAVQDVGNGQTVVRVDAQVMWLDRQPASE
jgi:hypothetical protein